MTTEFEGVEVQPPLPAKSTVPPMKILREVRSWGIWLIVIGVVSLFMNGVLSASWGTMILIVGLASFYFRSSAMLVVYGTTIAMAAILNVLAGSTGWVFYAFLQVAIAVQTFLRYFQFRKVEAEMTPEAAAAEKLTPGRTRKVFPWLSFSLGLVALVGWVIILALVFVLAYVTRRPSLTPAFTFAETLAVDLGILAMAAGLASLLGKYPRRGFAITGMVLGFLPLLTELILHFLS